MRHDHRRFKEIYIKKKLHLNSLSVDPYSSKTDQIYFQALEVNYFCEYISSYLAHLHTEFTITKSEILVGELLSGAIALPRKFSRECVHFINVLDGMSNMTPQGEYTKAVLLLVLYMQSDKQKQQIRKALRNPLSCSMASIASLLYMVYKSTPSDIRYRFALADILNFNGHAKCAFYIRYPYPSTPIQYELDRAVS